MTSEAVSTSDRAVLRRCVDGLFDISDIGPQQNKHLPVQKPYHVHAKTGKTLNNKSCVKYGERERVSEREEV